MFSLLKEHMQALRLMLDRCRQLHISLNLKKCIFCTPFGTLLGHVMCKDGLLVDQAKITTILDMVAPTSGPGDAHHIGSYRILPRFIQNYAKIVAPLEKLLHKDTKYILDTRMPGSLGYSQRETCHCTNSSFS
jgi:hypothetical protein